ncbi:hypothetical protein ACJJTC_006718 [Scirpophaga incertulas]
MNNPKLYQEYNFATKRDAFDFLTEYADKIKWKKKGAKIIDIGCGDGSVTATVLKNFIPDNFEQLLGSDINETMVNFANECHMDDKTKFSVLDIASDLPEDMKRQFDHVFSFYALHWIKKKKQETAFKNIFELITAGGNCLLMFVGYHTFHDIYRTLAQREKWRSCLHPLDGFVSPYYDSQEPEQEIRTLLSNIGFSDIVVRCQDKMFVYDSPDTMMNVVRAVNPFKMSKEMWDDFAQDYLQVIQDQKTDIDETSTATIHYSLITVYATK